MSSSYPFLTIAKERGIPYREVLSVAEELNALGPNAITYWSGMCSWRGDVACALTTERQRREQVAALTPLR
jgi:hypothetical protein